MKRPLVALMICIALAIAVLLPATRPVQAGSNSNPAPAFSASPDTSAAAGYCVAKGGEVDTRAPYFNTNDNPQNWFRLAGNRSF